MPKITPEQIEDIKKRYSIIGNSPLLNEAISAVYIAALSGRNVFIQGATGSGKEAFARIVAKEAEQFFPGQFLSVNCSALSPDLIDSHFFGHVKGAFTGADSDHEGIFETCNNGTVFLDEISELPLSAQARLLRVLETGEYTRVGDNTVRKTKVRVVSATHTNMVTAVNNKEFRADLFARLNMSIPVRVPSLTDRTEDIPLLFNHFVRQYLQDTYHPKCEPVRLSNEGAEFLKRQAWSGNVRDLREFAYKVTFAESGNKALDEASLKPYLPETFLPATKKDSQTLYGEFSNYIYLFTESLKSFKTEIAMLRSEVNLMKAKLAEKDPEFNTLLNSQVALASSHLDNLDAETHLLTHNLATPSATPITDSPLKMSVDEEFSDYEEIVETEAKKKRKTKK